MLIKTLGM